MGGRLQRDGQDSEQGPELNELQVFPAYAFTTQQRDTKTFILDEVRRQWVRLTPEEWVRQHLLRALFDLGYPRSLTAVEKSFEYLERTWRADVAVFDRHHQPLLLAECKAPHIPVTAAVFDQIARYNVVIKSHSLLVTNGHILYFGTVEDGTIKFLDAIPPYDSIVIA